VYEQGLIRNVAAQDYAFYDNQQYQKELQAKQMQIAAATAATGGRSTAPHMVGITNRS
jgi:hypothetical protein